MENIKITKSRKPKSKPKQKKKGTTAGMGTYMVKTICSITDPFCPAARTGKYPDSGGSRSLVFPMIANYDGTTDANGNISICFYPGYTYQYSVGVVTPPTTVAATAWNAFSTAPSFSAADQYRVNSAGLILNSTCPPLSAGGMVRVRIFTTPHQITGFDAATYNCIASYDVPLRNLNNLAVNYIPISELSRLWAIPSVTQPDALTANAVSNGWPIISVSVIGGPASTGVLSVKAFFNYEITFQDNDPVSLVTTPSPAKNDLVGEISSAVHKSVGNFVQGGIKAVERAVISKAAAFIARSVGGPVSTALAIAVD